MEYSMEGVEADQGDHPCSDISLSNLRLNRVQTSPSNQTQDSWPDDGCTPQLDQQMESSSSLDDKPFAADRNLQYNLSERKPLSRNLKQHSSSAEESDYGYFSTARRAVSRGRQQKPRTHLISKRRKRVLAEDYQMEVQRQNREEQNAYYSQFFEDSPQNPYYISEDEVRNAKRSFNLEPDDSWMHGTDSSIMEKYDDTNIERQRSLQSPFLEHPFRPTMARNRPSSISSAVSYRSQDRNYDLPHTPLRQRDQSPEARFGLNRQKSRHKSNLGVGAKSHRSFDLTGSPDFAPVRTAQKRQRPIFISLIDSPDESVAASIRTARTTTKKEVISLLDSPELEAATFGHARKDKDDFSNDSNDFVSTASVQSTSNIMKNSKTLSCHPDTDMIIFPSVQDIPMRQRITLAKISPIKNMRKRFVHEIARELLRPTPKKQKVAANDAFMTNEQRHRHTAEIIINKELQQEREIQERELFDDVGEDEFEETVRLKQVRAEAQRWREERAAAAFAKQEAEKQAELERKKLQEEAAEKSRIEKKMEDEKNRIRREAERSRQLALDAIEREERRRKAQEKIEADRKRQAAEEEAREREKQADLQAKVEDLAKIKAKKEETKKQAASLSAFKRPSTKAPKEAFKKNDKFHLHDLTGDDDLESLLPETTKEHSRNVDVQQESRGRSTSPGLFVQSVKNSPITALGVKNPEKEMLDIHQTALNFWAKRCAAKEQAAVQVTEQTAQLAIQEVAQSVELYVPPTAREISKPLNQTSQQVTGEPAKHIEPYISPIVKNRPDPSNQAAQRIVQLPEQDNPTIQDRVHSLIASQNERIDSQAHHNLLDASANNHSHLKSQPISQPHGELHIPIRPTPAASKSGTLVKLVPGVLSSPPLPKFKLPTRMISDVERETIEKESKEKLAKEKAELKRIRSEKAKAETQRKNDEKAREKKRQEFLTNAFEKDIPITEDELEAKLDEYMEKREKDNARRRERHRGTASKSAQGIQDSNSNNNWPRPVVNIAPPKLFMFDEDLPEEDILGASNREPYNILREDIRAERGAAFRRAAAITNIRQLQQDSEESEEDPDDEPPAKPTNSIANSSSRPPTLTIDQEDSSCDESDIENENDNGNNNDDSTGIDKQKNRHLEPTIRNVQFVTPSSSFESRQSQVQNSGADQETLPKVDSSNPDMVYIHEVKIERTIGDEQSETMHVGNFNSIEEANNCVHERAEFYRKEIATHRVVENRDYNSGGRIQSQLDFYPPEELGSMIIYITSTPKASSIYTPEVLASLPKVIPPSYWIVVQTTIVEETNDDGQKHLMHKSEIKDHYPVREMANFAACTLLSDLTKPKSPKIDWIKDYEQFSKMWRELRKEADDKGAVFDAEVVKQEKRFEWLAWMKIGVKVERVEMRMKGPLN